jgi:hypothetical protein
MKHFLWLGWLFWLVGGPCARGQALHVERTLELGQPRLLASDRYGNLYVADQEGNINRYDSLGNFSLNFSPPKLAEVSLLDARPTVRIFAFYRELQEFTLLDRFLVPIDQFRLDLPELGFVRVAAPSLDNQLWLYDDVNFAIKKFDKNANRVTFRVPLDLLLSGSADYDINYLAEYQNQLFVNDRNSGILWFDNLGNLQRKLTTQTEGFNFWGDELYFLEGEAIRFVHLYLGREHRWPLPTGLVSKVKQVIVQGKRAYLLTESLLLVCKFSEK